MSFDWFEFFNLAEELAGRKKSKTTDEAKYRTSISRAYYACFCIARNKLIQRGINISKSSSSHEEVRNYFIQHSNKSYKEIGSHLDRLRIDRNIADYRDVVHKVDILATKVLLEAGDTIDILNQI